MAADNGLQQSEHYHLFDTTFGPCGVAWSARGLKRLQLPERDAGATEKRLRARATEPGSAPSAIRHVVAMLQGYFAGDKSDFSGVELDLGDVGPFHLTIYRLTRDLGWGETATYGELALRAGSPGSARAVGQAMGRNPVPIIIPCHRVLAAGRKVGGFSAFGGTVTKERLLRLEGVSLLAEAPLLALLESNGLKP